MAGYEKIKQERNGRFIRSLLSRKRNYNKFGSTILELCSQNIVSVICSLDNYDTLLKLIDFLVMT